MTVVIGARAHRSGERVLPLHFRGLDISIDVLDTATNRVKLRVPSTSTPEILHGRD